jgi:SAM-dependent methyltransferase
VTAAPSSTYTASDGEAYERFLGRWTRRLAEKVIDVADIPASGGLLDVGCGTGSLAMALAERFPQRDVVGVDIAAPYIAFARRQSKNPSLAFRQGDATALPWPNGSFAASFSQLVLTFIPKPEMAVREMKRVTRPGGVVVGAVWDFRGGLVYQRLFWDTAVAFDPSAAVVRNRLFANSLSLPEGLADLWKSVGLDNVSRNSVTSRMDFADFTDYWEPLQGGQGPVGVYVNGLMPDMRDVLRERVRDAFLAGADDGPRSLTATAWVVLGVVP